MKKEEGYISTYPFAVNYINDLVDYIVSNLPSSFHKNAPSFFSKYGSNLKYIIYKTRSNTTWYILFEEHPDSYLVTYITNNKYEGQYFNV